MRKMCFLAFCALCLLSTSTNVFGTTYEYKCAPIKVSVTSTTSGYKLEIPVKVKRLHDAASIEDRTLQVVFSSSQIEGTYTYKNGVGTLVNKTTSGTYFKDATHYYYLDGTQYSSFKIGKQSNQVYEIQECTLYFTDNTNFYVCYLSYDVNTLSDASEVEPFLFVGRATDKNYIMKNITDAAAQYDEEENQTHLTFKVQGVNVGSTYNYEVTLILNNNAFLAGDYAIGSSGVTLNAQSFIYWPDKTSPATRYPLEEGTLLRITHETGDTYRLSGTLCARKAGSTSTPYLYNFGSTGLEFTCRINYTILDNEDKTDFISKIKASDADFDLTLGRTLSNAYYNTFCSPIAISEDEVIEMFGYGTDIRALEGSSFDERQNQLTLTFSENSLNKIQAGVPYLIKPGLEVINPTFANVVTSRLTTEAQKIETANADFYGILSPYTLYSSDPEFLFLAANNQLMWGDAGTMKGMRAYFKIKGISDKQQAAMVPARMQFGSISTPTDLIETNKVQGTMHDGKYLDKGRLVIIHNGKKYNL